MPPSSIYINVFVPNNIKIDKHSTMPKETPINPTKSTIVFELVRFVDLDNPN